MRIAFGGAEGPGRWDRFERDRACIKASCRGVSSLARGRFAGRGEGGFVEVFELPRSTKFRGYLLDIQVLSITAAILSSLRLGRCDSLVYHTP